MAKFRYPTGVRALLVDETARRRSLEGRFVAALERNGFAEIVLPIIDYLEPYAPLVGRDAAKQSYRFVDREGELVAIRSDFTPMVARALAPVVTSDELPLRVFYRGDVIRCDASRLGVNRELFQVGAEIIGDASPQCDAEVLRVAAAIARELGHRPLVIYNDVAIAEAVIDACGAYGAEVRSALVAKRSADLAALRDQVDGEALALARKLADATATLDDVRAFAPTRAAAERLAATAALLEPDAFVLQLDDVDDSAGYYTGLRFRLYAGAQRLRIAQGGRYDTLYRRFGNDAAAIGFTFTVDDLD